MDPAPRTAVLVDWFANHVAFGRTIHPSLPGGLVGGSGGISPRRLAAHSRTTAWAGAPTGLPALTHALIVCSNPGDPLLSAAERDRLWRAFRVPVFEQIIGPDGELLAAECDAHDGLHVEVPGCAWDEYRVETAPCACGRKTPRLHVRRSPSSASPQPRPALRYGSRYNATSSTRANVAELADALDLGSSG